MRGIRWDPTLVRVCKGGGFVGLNGRNIVWLAMCQFNKHLSNMKLGDRRRFILGIHRVHDISK